jgi:hypothetical protein
LKKWISDLNRRKFRNGLNSQSYQDELLEIIFDNLGTTNSVPFCVEFGFNSSELETGSGANVAKLVLEKKWDSLLLDGDNENHSINLHKHFLTSENICRIFKSYNVPKEPEYISIDVDSTDLWLFRSLLKNYRAMVYSVEYNSNYPLNKAITFPNDSEEHWQNDRGYGASLKALTMVAAEHGYSLVWVVRKLDVFFVRDDLIEDGSNMKVFPYKKWANCTNIRSHGPLKDRKKASIYLDYEVFTKSNGDILASKQAAYETCMTYLVAAGFSGKANKLLRLLKKIWKPWNI